MLSGMKVLGGVAPRGLIATAHVSAGSTQPQVYPVLMNFQAFLAAQGARHHGLDSIEMRAFDFHGRALSSVRWHPSCDVFLVLKPFAVMQ
jgi:hypothetical protein